MKRLPIDYQGFKLGLRVSTQFAMLLDSSKTNEHYVLHKLKNMGNVVEGMRRFNAFSVNNKTYSK